MTYKTYEEFEENTPYDEKESPFEWGKMAWNESEKATEERLTKKPVKQKRSHKLLKLYYLWIKLIIEDCEGEGMCSEEKKEAYHEYIKEQLLPETEAISVCIYSKTVKSYYIPRKSIKGFDNKQMLAFMKDVQGFTIDKYNMVLPLPGDRGYDQMAEKYKDWL